MLLSSRDRTLTHSHTPLTMTHTPIRSHLQTHTPALTSPSTPASTCLFRITLPSPLLKPCRILALPISIECFMKTCVRRLIWTQYPIGPHTLSVAHSHTCRPHHRGLVGQTLLYPIILPCLPHSVSLLWVTSQGWVSMGVWALYGAVEPASDTSSAQSAGRVSPHRRVWTRTCAFTPENGRIAVSSAGSVSRSRDTSRLTRLSTPERDRTSAPAVENGSQANSTCAYTPRNTTLTYTHSLIYRLTHSRTRCPERYTHSQQRMQDIIFVAFRCLEVSCKHSEELIKTFSMLVPSVILQCSGPYFNF